QPVAQPGGAASDEIAKEVVLERGHGAKAVGQVVEWEPPKARGNAGFIELVAGGYVVAGRRFAGDDERESVVLRQLPQRPGGPRHKAVANARVPDGANAGRMEAGGGHGGITWNSSRRWRPAGRCRGSARAA